MRPTDCIIEAQPYRIGPGDLMRLGRRMARRVGDPEDPWRFYAVGFRWCSRSLPGRTRFAACPDDRRAIAPAAFWELLVVWQGRRHRLPAVDPTKQALYEAVRLAAAAEHPPQHYTCVDQAIRRVQAQWHAAL